MTEPQLNGTCAERFEPVYQAVQHSLRSGEEVGASLYIDVDGYAVVDLYGGFRDEARTEPWTEDTITNVFSSTKSVTNLAALVLVERGELDVHAPVAEYWPEFSANGKEGVLVRHLMAHTSGVSGWQEPMEVEDLYDWEKSTSLLAAQSPWWEPGTAAGYHAQNQGHLIGEVMRRITGMTLKQFVAQELAGPLDADFQIGAKPEDSHRIAPVIAPPSIEVDFDGVDPNSPAVKTLANPRPMAENALTADWRAADIGAMNGHGNAASVAKLLRPIALDGESNGTKLLSTRTIDLIFDVQADGVDVVLGAPFRRGIGYALPQLDSVPYIPEGRICFWGGWGGSVILTDLDRRMTISYMMNKMAPGIVGSERFERYCTAAYKCADAAPSAVG